jgi:hypothetical protein
MPVRRRKITTPEVAMPDVPGIAGLAADVVGQLEGNANLLCATIGPWWGGPTPENRRMVETFVAVLMLVEAMHRMEGALGAVEALAEVRTAVDAWERDIQREAMEDAASGTARH